MTHCCGVNVKIFHFFSIAVMSNRVSSSTVHTPLGPPPGARHLRPTRECQSHHMLKLYENGNKDIIPDSA